MKRKPSDPDRPSAALPTLEDVARRAGVSTATVSRCLNAPERVVEQTRARVMEAIEALGYAPNHGARLLAAKRSYTVGAVIPTMENAIFARGLQAFQEALASAGFTLLVSSSSYRQDVEEEQIRTLIARGADGLLLIGHDRSPAAFDFLERRGVPFVVAWAFDAAQGRPSVGFDNRAAMKDLAARVLALGHRDIAVISAPRATNDRARQRVEGVAAAIGEAGGDPGRLKVIETAYSIENGAAAMDALLQSAPRPTAVMCGNDVLAIGALQQARALGLSVPGEVSITGFDDIEIAGIASPPLATVHVPHREMGQAAAAMLIALIAGQSGGPNRRLDTRLVLRETLGPAP